MRSHVTQAARSAQGAGQVVSIPQAVWDHMWPKDFSSGNIVDSFQYRKRYEITCDTLRAPRRAPAVTFQYRKRYEITCDLKTVTSSSLSIRVSIPQAVWDHMWREDYQPSEQFLEVSIPQAVWDHMWLQYKRLHDGRDKVSIPQAVWDHMWPIPLPSRVI